MINGRSCTFATPHKKGAMRNTVKINTILDREC